MLFIHQVCRGYLEFKMLFESSLLFSSGCLCSSGLVCGTGGMMVDQTRDRDLEGDFVSICCILGIL